ncbi:tRNA (adenosine(37)-N6)-dimethylallyltransferase MiaA [Halothiobacillus sp. DCM-1]|uniref:tRNA (adenosine(37)-N6)-dimethylallyltransferase MiaA n=1 Tax=Halothiobacillus sp. DCM-1 TaxID=3112558 RepID=UPI00324D456A
MTDAANRPILALLGPTASGKTALALELAARYPVGLISVDSVMIYREMDIGAAKPAPAVLAEFPHALVDVCDPAESYSVQRFCREAMAAIQAIEAQGRIPLLVGGTMMYFQALLDGLSELPMSRAATRAAVQAEAKARGWPALHAQLAEVDPVTAARIHPTDPQRISRALEVFRDTGRSLSDWQKHHPPVSPLMGRVVHRWGLWPSSRAHARATMAMRFDEMLADGLVDEVARLRARGDLSPAMPSLRAVGYRQIWSYLAGETDLPVARELAITATRQLAKRQITWMRGQTQTQFFEAERRERAFAAMASVLDRAMDQGT